jgi:DNA-binding transcriptional LysR family regulator
MADAERDIVKLAGKPSGRCASSRMPYLLRLADAGHGRVSPELAGGRAGPRFGLSPDPFELLAADRADLVIGSQTRRSRGIVQQPLFRFEIMAVLPTDHPLAARRHLTRRISRVRP